MISLLVSCKTETSKSEPAVLVNNRHTAIIEIKNPSLINSSLPRLFSNGEDLLMSWIQNKDSIASLKYSKFNGINWTAPTEIISGSDWFVNWADFPAIADNNGSILTNILKKSAEGTYTYDIHLQLYSKQKNTWKNNILLNQDGIKSEHGFVSMLPYNNDSFFVTWLDGRTLVGVPKENEQMTLRAAFIDAEGEISNDILLDDKTCECCNTAATMTSNGPIVAYRDRSDTEIRDISIVRFVNGNWTAPKNVYQDHWEIPGCPVNGPAIDSFNDAVALAWFTAENDNPRIQVSFSENQGETFGLQYRVDNGNAIGRVDIVMIDQNNAVVSWMEPDGIDTLIQILKVSSNGEKNIPITITKTRSERSSGFPQLELVGDRLYVAWTSLEDKKPTIKIVTVLASDL
jgi:hypothetical protein|tara:strand:- start:3476 stop:4681 length:1206 start_codon:yes stop_codon:yes gene_type:complete